MTFKNDPSLTDITTHLENLEKTPKQYRQINTFVKRRTHIGQTAQNALLDGNCTILVNRTQSVGILGDVSAINDLRALFEHTPNGKQAPLTLEIGFGMGGSLLQMAQNTPNINFVGIEVHEPGIGKIVHEAQLLKLTNLKIINGDAIALLNNLPHDHIDTLQLYFPDPWQKKRHYKRRFVTPERMALVASRLKTGGIFHTATDWEHYAFWMLEVLENCPYFENLAGVGNFSPRPTHRPLTKFEQRGLTSGHGVWDLIYRKQ